MENLWQLLGKRTNIEDKPGAKDLVVQRGDAWGGAFVPCFCVCPSRLLPGHALDTPALEHTERLGDVAYQNVTYEYEPGSVVLQNVSFTVPGGHTIAFVVSPGVAVRHNQQSCAGWTQTGAIHINAGAFACQASACPRQSYRRHAHLVQGATGAGKSSITRLIFRCAYALRLLALKLWVVSGANYLCNYGLHVQEFITIMKVSIQ
eukprot:1138087-Pelagomonas_calceolata.AAC.2